MNTYALHFTVTIHKPTCSFNIDILCTVTSTTTKEALKQARYELDQVLKDQDTQQRQLDYVIPLTLENTNNERL